MLKKPGKQCRISDTRSEAIERLRAGRRCAVFQLRGWEIRGLPPPFVASEQLAVSKCMGPIEHTRTSEGFQMARRYRRMMRMTATVASAGMLLQAGGCVSGDTISGLLLSVLGSLVQSFVFGGFNLV